MGEISVVIPVYNRASCITKALACVDDQSRRPLEVLVVDDCSTDTTAGTVQSYPSDIVRCIRHDRNQGAPAARNTGLNIASGDFIAFLDSDDEWDRTFLEKAAAQLEKLSEAWCGAYAWIRHENGRVGGGQIIENHLPGLLKHNSIGGTSSVLFRRTAVLEVNGFHVGLSSRQDLDLYLRLALKGYRFKTIPETLVFLNEGNGQITRNGDALVRGYQQFYSLHREKIRKSHASVEHLRRCAKQARNMGAGKTQVMSFLRMAVRDAPFDIRSYLNYVRYLLKYRG